jgi:hypothetical protein
LCAQKIGLLPDSSCRPRCGLLIAASEKTSKDQLGLGIEDPRIERAQTQRDLELLDCGLYVSEPKLSEPAPMSCDKPDLGLDLSPA